MIKKQSFKHATYQADQHKEAKGLLLYKYKHVGRGGEKKKKENLCSC